MLEPTVLPSAAAQTPEDMVPAESFSDPGLPAAPEMEFFASIAINGEPKGTFLVANYANGDFAVRQEDLVSIGIDHPVGNRVSLNGETHVLLSTLKEATFAFDERNVQIDIEVDPSILATQFVDARRRRSQAVVEYPRDTSAFLNYAYSDDDGEFGARVLSAEVGARYGNFLLLTDGFHERVEDADRTVRLNSSLTYDNRETLQQAILGDFVTGSGPLGSAMNLGGLSFSKNYQIDPYFIRYPYANFSGLAGSPSQYEVLVNGNRVSTGRLQPGPFEITNIQGPIGISDVEVVVRDAFGRERYYATSFYFTQSALREGLNEYNLAVGARRRQFGVESNNYGPVAATGFYRHGTTDFLTLGGRAETSEDVFNLGPNLTFLAGRWGLFNTTLSYSQDSGDDGTAGVFEYAIQTRKFNANAYLLSQSREYARIGTDPALNTSLEAAASFSTGPFTLRYLTSRRYQGVDRTAYGITYSPRLPSPRLSLTASLRRIEDEAPRTELYVGINYFFKEDYSVTATVRATEDDRISTASVQKTTPIGEGWGFSAAASEFENSQGSGHSVRPYVQYNARYATMIADYQSVTIEDDTQESRRLAILGSVSTVGGEVMFSRPVTDAFALVQVDDLKDIRVYQNGRYAGKTDRKGRLLIPAMSSYVHNQVSVDSRDVPMNFELNRYTKLISPALRGGAVLDFGAKRIQAVAGTLNIRRDGQATPVRYGEISLLIDGKQVTHPVGQTGEFFIENLEPSTYTLSYFGASGSCTVLLDVPASDEPIIEMGDLLCSPD